LQYRWGEGRNDRLPALAEDLVAHHAAAILAAGGTEPARMAMGVTKTIPICLYQRHRSRRDGSLPLTLSLSDFGNLHGRARCKYDTKV
jgi:hypothetical protein